jgi:hypothetical protein
MNVYFDEGRGLPGRAKSVPNGGTEWLGDRERLVA